MLASAETTEVPWEQQALNLVIQTVQEALHEKPPGEQQPLQMALMTLRGFLAASRLTQEEGGTNWEPFLEPIAPSDMSRIAAWSQTLRERREAASLSHHKLAELSGVPEGALQALEGGTYAPSQMALLHLLGGRRTAVSVVRRAGAFGRDHGGAQRLLRPAAARELGTLGRLFEPLQDLPADAAGLLFRRLRTKREALLGIKKAIRRREL